MEIHPNFISEVEETQLIHELDLKIPWSTSQSGRRKQNFGPKANFRKRKAKLGDFCGYPLCTKFIQDKFPSVPSFFMIITTILGKYFYGLTKLFQKK